MSTAEAAAKPVQLYRQFLTPALHRRFTNAAGLGLIICYAISITVREELFYIWPWFPIGPAGLRTLLFFISCLVIFILRVSQLHLRPRTTGSPFETAVQILYSIEVPQTLAFYTFSAWWFTEVYLWSVPGSAGMSLVIDEELWDARPKLNERPIFFRTFILVLAIVQSFMHAFSEASYVPLPLPKPTYAINPPTGELTAMEQLRHRMPQILQGVIMRVTIATFSNFLVYTLIVRKVAWDWSLWFARLFWSVPRSSQPPTLPPSPFYLILRCSIAGLMLVFLWETSNAAFSAYVGQVPLKSSTGKALTDDARDPNGSLLNGLMSRKETVKTFAFWELCFISTCEEGRRKVIFADLDRNSGSAWSQIMKASLEIIAATDARIGSLSQRENKSNEVQHLPRLSSPLKTGTVFQTPQPTSTGDRIQAQMSKFAKYVGTTKPTSQAPAAPKQNSSVQKYLILARDRLLSETQQDTLGFRDAANISPSETFKTLLARFLASPQGSFFRVPMGRHISTQILGTPRSDLGSLLHAIDSLAGLALAGVAEDQYGTVSRDVPQLVRVFTRFVDRIERFVTVAEPHWTDVLACTAEERLREGTERSARSEANGKAGGSRDQPWNGGWNDGADTVKQVELLVDHLRISLQQLIIAYEKYAADIGLAREEIREAKKAAGMSLL